MHYFILSINWSRFLCYEISALCLWLCTVIEGALLPSISLLKTNLHLFRRQNNTVKATLCAKRLQSMSCIINKTVSNKIMFLSSQYTCTCKLLVFFFFSDEKRLPWRGCHGWYCWPGGIGGLLWYRKQRLSDARLQCEWPVDFSDILI